MSIETDIHMLKFQRHRNIAKYKAHLRVLKYQIIGGVVYQNHMSLN